MAKAIPDYNFREGDLVLVKFEEFIHQPGISRYQSNEHHPRSDFTKATSWKKGYIEMVGDHADKKMYWVQLVRPYKSYEKGWVEYERLQPYVRT